MFSSSAPLTSMDSSKESLVNDFMYGSNVANSHISIRLGFIRKVYGILSVQLGFTTLVGALMLLMPTLTEFIKTNNWIIFGNLFVTIGVLIALMVKRTEYPANFYLLGAFTFLESISVGVVVSFYETWTVIQAFFLTTVIVISLTLYTFQSKRDFKTGGAMLFSLLTILFFGGLIQIFVQSPVLHFGLALLGAFIFSGFIIYDTQQIMKHLHAEEYIVGVINLYLDIINLFLEILKILDSLKNK